MATGQEGSAGLPALASHSVNGGCWHCPPPHSYTTTTATSTLILQYTHTLWQLHLPLDKHYYPKYTHWRLTPAHERKRRHWPFFFPPFTAFLWTARMQKFIFFKYLPAFVSFLKVHSLNFLRKPGLEDTVKGLPLTPGARSSLMVYTCYIRCSKRRKTKLLYLYKCIYWQYVKLFIKIKIINPAKVLRTAPLNYKMFAFAGTFEMVPEGASAVLSPLNANFVPRGHESLTLN